ncbi:MAG: hypothetical protein IPJ28_02845 [Betaproteobacteria bacterium]|nr:hypothetical protein [Betaproteobacteria bacterium]
MNKFVSMLVATAFATASVGAFAAAHGGAMSDADKAKKMEACKKMDAKADDKMKAECKKMMEGRRWTRRSNRASRAGSFRHEASGKIGPRARFFLPAAGRG